MNIVDLIIKKRNGTALLKEELQFFIDGVCDETIPDYQASAMLMAIFLQGLSPEETAHLTFCMAHSGNCLDLSLVNGFKVDKHSTGGISDTTTLILSPLVASLGVPVVKMSGKGLGFTGGTIDKLESIHGFRTTLTDSEAVGFARQTGLVIMAQSAFLAPADKKLYALRDVTGTVDSIPLIAASIMSKKIASGSDGIVLDIKCGSGAFMKNLESAEALASEMVSIGKKADKKVTAVISGMSQPLGNNIGNSLEVIEAIEVLKGNISGDLKDISVLLGAHMLLLSSKVSSLDEGRTLISKQIENGGGLKKFREMIKNQGGNPEITDDYSLFSKANDVYELKSEKEGYMFSMDCSLIGRASIETGAGRLVKDGAIDYSAGIVMKKRIGDYVLRNETIAIIHSSSKEKCINAGNYLLKAFCISDRKPTPTKLILDYR